MPNEINNDQLQGLTHSHLKTNLINLEFGRGCESDVYYYMMYMVKRGSKNGCAMEVDRGLLDLLPRGPIVISSWSLVDLTTPCVMIVHAKFVCWSFTNIYSIACPTSIWPLEVVAGEASAFLVVRQPIRMLPCH